MASDGEQGTRVLHGTGAVAFSTRGEYGVRFMVALARMDHHEAHAVFSARAEGHCTRTVQSACDWLLVLTQCASLTCAATDIPTRLVRFERILFTCLKTRDA